MSALVAIGAISRLLPLLDQGGRLLRQFPTEDGYLMLTIARNLALGHGMSVAGGTIATNGTQPLATFLYALGFAAAGGDKTSGVALAQGIQLAIGAVAAWWLYRLGLRVFAPAPDPRWPAALAAAVWWATPLDVRHTMNGLETGVYALTTIVVAWALLRPAPTPARGPLWIRWAGIGALLALAFWARNDAVLLCGAVGVAHLAGVLPPAGTRLRDRVLELAVAAAVVVALAAPWLLHNLLGFGHLMPISGQAESLSAEIGQNLTRLPPVLFEYFLMVVPIPAPLESAPGIVAVSAVAVWAGVAAVVRAARSWTPEQRALGAVAALFTLLLCGFYGLFFGAGHFVSRYLFAASPFFALLWAGAATAAARRVRPALAAAGGAALVLLVLGLSVRLYALGTQHDHWQVVQWVDANVPDDVWVAAVQTGTLGFFHDRTLNLDGKVNPEALEARRQDRIPAYVASSPAQYVVDWQGIERWVRKPALAPHFEVVVADRVHNLAVLQRRGAPRKAAAAPSAARGGGDAGGG